MSWCTSVYMLKQLSPIHLKGCLSLGEQRPCEGGLLPSVWLRGQWVAFVLSVEKKWRLMKASSPLLTRYLMDLWGFLPHIPATPSPLTFWSRPQVILQVSLARGRVSILQRGEVRDSVLARSRESGLSFKSRRTVPFSENLKPSPVFEKLPGCLC